MLLFVFHIVLGSGEIEFEEFCTMMANRMNQPIDSPQELIEAFEVNSFSLSYKTTCPFTDKVEVHYT